LDENLKQPHLTTSNVNLNVYEKLESSKWQTVYEGLQELKGLITTDSNVVVQKANFIIPILCKLITHDNETLSQISMMCLTYLYQTTASVRQKYLKNVIPVLIRKAVDKNTMLSNEAMTSISIIISSVDSSVLKEMIIQLLKLSKEADSEVVIKQSAHYIALIVGRIKYMLIREPTSETPLLALIKGAGNLISMKDVNTRKKAQEIITLLSQEALRQASLVNFKKIVQNNISNKHMNKFMEVIKKIDPSEEDNGQYDYCLNTKVNMEGERITKHLTKKTPSKRKKNRKSSSSKSSSKKKLQTKSYLSYSRPTSKKKTSIKKTSKKISSKKKPSKGKKKPCYVHNILHLQNHP